MFPGVREGRLVPGGWFWRLQTPGRGVWCLEGGFGSCRHREGAFRVWMGRVEGACRGSG